MRVGATVKWLLVLAVATEVHRHHGAPIDYVGLAAAAAASWVGLPGPGEPLLIAAGVLAARHRLQISEVLVVAWIAASVGGVVGWLAGMIAGRTVVTASGPLYSVRRGAVARGDQVFSRHPVVAILLTPSWVAGIHRVRTAVYLPINVASAALWAAGFGLGAYLIGPSVIDFAQDFGVATTVAVVLLLGGAIAGELLVRRRRRGRRSQESELRRTAETAADPDTAMPAAGPDTATPAPDPDG